MFSAGELGRISGVLQANGRCACLRTLATCPVWSEAPAVSTKGHMSTRMALDFIIRTQHPAWIVDASKTAYLSFWRPLYYKVLGHQVVIIHLVRDLKSVVESTLNGTNKQLEAGKRGERLLGRQRTLLGWMFANMFAAAYRATFSKSVLMHYEDLVSNPARELRRMEALTSLDYALVAALITSGSPLPEGHEIAGNRALRAGDMVFRLSDRPA